MALAVNQIERVYSGKAGSCCCGCSGKYYEAAESKTMTTKVAKLINKHIVGADIDEGGEYIAVELGQRLYVAYLKQEAA